MNQWIVLVLLVILIECIHPEPASDSEEYPLTRSLGFSTSDLGKTSDSRLNQEFMEKYQEMKKASQESFENFATVREEKRRRRVIGDVELEQMREGNELQNRRTNANKLQSAVGRRRARSQALRREKLKSQSLRSHLLHTKQTNIEYID